MMPALCTVTWAEANQTLLAAEFARLKRLLGAEAGVRAPGAVQARELFPDAPAAIDQLCELFDLSPFERDVLLLCAGVEMDSELAARCGEAQGQAGRTPNFGLAMGALAGAHWSALTPARALRRFQLIHLDATRQLTAAPLRIDERILHFIAGTNLLDARLDALVRAPEAPTLLAGEHRSLAARAAGALRPEHAPVVLLCGKDASGQQDIAHVAARDLGLRLLCVRAEDLPAAGADLDAIVMLLERECLLLPAVILLQCDAGVPVAAARRLAERFSGPLMLATRESLRLNRTTLRLDVDKPPPAEQRRLWTAVLGNAAAEGLGRTLDEVCEQFSLSAATIGSAARVLAAADSAAPHALWDACRAIARPRLADLAERIVPACGWEDLILPAGHMDMLRRLVAQVRHRMQVHEAWGFAGRGRRGLGVSALFTGESGTGKTLAAEVLAAELRLDLYRIDLSSVVSKYIGDTEKNLRQVFDAAEDGGVLLLFDEADALFGKRAEVKDSHDRYANIEVGYLLQRMEAYQGLAILTTNLKSSLDRAFQRRLRFVINFPFPDAAQRAAIWRRIFPPDTPALGLDHERLAQLNVAGGNIRNIALSAAFLAAEAHSPVRMAHLLEAARMEAQKIERPLATAEIRGWV